MSEDCEVRFTAAAVREMTGIAKKNPERAAVIHDLLARIEENGWKLSTHSRVIKVLRSQTCVGEIRDVGSGGYRLFHVLARRGGRARTVDLSNPFRTGRGRHTTAERRVRCGRSVPEAISGRGGMMFDRKGSRFSEVFAAIEAEVPELARVEKELGSRLVVARNVMGLRIQRGLTQQQLAQALGVKQPRVAQIESASANLQIDTLDRLAAVFGVEPARLLQSESSGSRSHERRMPEPVATA